MKRIIPSLGLIICLISFGQTVSGQSFLKQADEQYHLFNYSKAADLYLKAYKNKPTLYTTEQLAACYAFMRDYNNTETWYAKAVATKGSKPADILNYAKALQGNAKYDDAKIQFSSYYELYAGVEKPQVKIWIASCDSASKWTKNPVDIDLKNEQSLNSAKSDWGVSAYHGDIVFTSDRIENNKAAAEHKTKKPFLKFVSNNPPPDKYQYGWTGDGYYKLFWLKKGAGPDSLSLFPLDAGTDYHIGSASFTANGNEVYFTITRTPQKRATDTDKIVTADLELYSCKKDTVTGKWGVPKAFRYNSPGIWSVGDPFITPDGKTLYFVANFPRGLGGTDIYYCKRDDNGDWMKPVNFYEVNTPGNERTPMLDAQGNLYFSSDGGIGMGGLDIFKALKSGKTFKPKQNLGYPINSSRDDFAYTIINGTTVYFASNREGGKGDDDIYSFTQKATPILAAKPKLQFKLEGVIYDTLTSRPLAHALVTLNRDLAEDQVVETGADGKYKFDLRENMDFNLKTENKGYLTVKATVTTKGLTSSQALKHDFFLRKFQLNKAIRIENIYYDYNKWNIRPDAAIELNKLIKILKDNPGINIEIGSHTDSRGSDSYNMQLSQQRANAVVDYLVNTGGIDKARLSARGYGETRLLNRCANGVNCSPAEHQLNRRTEFTVVKM